MTSIEPIDYENLMETLDSSMLSFPTKLGQIGTFKRANGLFINVIAFTEQNGFHPLRVNKNFTSQLIDLLLISEGENSHYCSISDVVKLRHLRSGSNAKHFC